jgi:hypothetical protein
LYDKQNKKKDVKNSAMEDIDQTVEGANETSESASQLVESAIQPETSSVQPVEDTYIIETRLKIETVELNEAELVALANKKGAGPHFYLGLTLSIACYALCFAYLKKEHFWMVTCAVCMACIALLSFTKCDRNSISHSVISDELTYRCYLLTIGVLVGVMMCMKSERKEEGEKSNGYRAASLVFSIISFSFLMVLSVVSTARDQEDDFVQLLPISLRSSAQDAVHTLSTILFVIFGAASSLVRQGYQRTSTGASLPVASLILVLAFWCYNPEKGECAKCFRKALEFVAVSLTVYSAISELSCDAEGFGTSLCTDF